MPASQHGQYHTQKWSVSNADIYEKYLISDTLAQFILIGMCIGIEMSTISPLFTSKCQHGQYRALKVEYLLPMPAFTIIIVLYNFRYKKLSKLCIQLLTYKKLVPYLPVNASMDNTVL